MPFRSRLGMSLVGVGLLLGLPDFARCDDDAPPSPTPSLGIPAIYLLVSPTVSQTLGFDENRRKRFSGLFQQLEHDASQIVLAPIPEGKEARPMDSRAIANRIRQLVHRYSVEAEKELSESEQARLRGIRWQLMSVSRFRDKEFQEILSLTDQQKRESYELSNAFVRESKQILSLRSSKKMTNDQARAQLREVETRLMLQVDGILDDFQRERQDAALGEKVPFKPGDVETKLRLARRIPAP